MSAVLASCPSCGEAVVDGDRFCERCGAEFDPATVAAVGGSASPADGEPAQAREGGPPPRPTSSSTTRLAAVRSACVRCSGVVDVDGYCTECGVKQPSPRDHMELDLATAAFVCDRGRRHARNEDSAALGSRPGRIAVVVCDGVSSAPDSDRASQAAVDAALAELLAEVPVSRAIAQATSAAQAAACLLAPPTGSVPSCTYVAAVVEAGVAASGIDAPASCVVTVAWVGDSRAYLVDHGGARRLTSDDSWAQDVVDAGEMTEAQAMADPRAHQITRWLGADAVPPVVARTAEVTVTGPARVLVCSDGLWNELSSDADLVALRTLDDRALVTARRLVDHANAAGGRDNITVALIDLPWPVPTASPSEEPT